jgi:DNA-directed RNA polymerase specialized sigma24 family protein
VDDDAAEQAGTRTGPTRTSRELERLARSNKLEELVRKLEAQFSGSRACGYAEEAVQAAVVKILARGCEPGVDKVEAYLAQTARRVMLDEIRRCGRLVEYPEEELDHPAWRDDSTPHRVVSEEAFAQIRATVERWSTQTVRATTLVFIDAVRDDDTLDSNELAERVSAVTGREVSSGTARKWLSRGFIRLQQELVNYGHGANP